MSIDWHLCERDFFHDLPLEREDFLLLAKKRSILKRMYLFREGVPASTCFYLRESYVKIIRSSPSGREPIYFLRRTGEFFGLAEVLDGEERRASAQAIMQCTVFDIGVWTSTS